MIKGKKIILRTIRERDLETLFTLDSDVANRGYFLLPHLPSEPQFKKQFHEDGFWGSDSGRLLITSQDDEILGSIWFQRSVGYFSALELGYHIFDANRRGQGLMSEALPLFVRYLFQTKGCNRLELRMETENLASERVAIKAGFTYEGTARGAMRHGGKFVDLKQYSILRQEVMDGQPISEVKW
jgi:RimJ/RimL family protein N-acetyltransferase